MGLTRMLAERPGARRRVIGAATCYGLLLALAAGGQGIAIVVLGAGVGVLIADWRLGGLGEDEPQLESTSRLPLAPAVLLLGPVAANLLILGLVFAGGHPFDEVPPTAGVGVVCLASTAGGVTAARHGAPDTSHGWWALAGGASGITMFGVLVVLASS